MIPVDFPETNCSFGAPPGFTDAQVRPIRAFVGEIITGSCDGTAMVIVAWKPDEADLERLNAGGPVFLTCLGGLPPHLLTTHFSIAKAPS